MCIDDTGDERKGRGRILSDRKLITFIMSGKIEAASFVAKSIGDQARKYGFLLLG